MDTMNTSKVSKMCSSRNSLRDTFSDCVHTKTKLIEFEPSKTTYCRQHENMTTVGSFFAALKQIFTCQPSRGCDEEKIVVTVVEGESRLEPPW